MNIMSLQKHILQVCILTTAGLFTRLAFAACPAIDSDLAQTVGEINLPLYNEKLLYCKQEALYNSNALTLKADPELLLPGGNQAISMGTTIQTQPLSNSINLSGFTPSSLDLNTGTIALSATLPNKNGAYGSPSLFNFYTKVIGNNCNSAVRGGNQYVLMKNYLRTHPNVFRINTAGTITSFPTSDNNADRNIIKITNAQLRNSNVPNQFVTADITLYHVNYGIEPTAFKDRNSIYRYCWLGVAVQLDIKNMNLNSAGSYDINIDVNSFSTQ